MIARHRKSLLRCGVRPSRWTWTSFHRASRFHAPPHQWKWTWSRSCPPESRPSRAFWRRRMQCPCFFSLRHPCRPPVNLALQSPSQRPPGMFARTSGAKSFDFRYFLNIKSIKRRIMNNDHILPAACCPFSIRVVHITTATNHCHQLAQPIHPQKPAKNVICEA
jgi:hypothetical protein